MKKLLIVALAAVAIFPSTASAHGIGQVYALPVPLQYYLLGAGLAVAFSFFILALFLNKKQDQKTDRLVAMPWLSKALIVLRVIGLSLLLLTVFTGILGRQNPTENFAPIFFWIYFLLGMGILSLVIGNIWDKINPFKVITDWVNSDSKGSIRMVSGAVGVVLLLALFWWELVSSVSFVPRIMGILLAVYTLANLAMSRLYVNWYERGEVFSVLFAFIGRLAHFRIGEDNQSLIVLSENKKLDGSPSPWWVLGIASILLAGASFDSLKESVMWFNWVKAVGFPTASKVAETIGLILSPVFFLLTYLLAACIVKQLVGKGYKTLTIAQQFVVSLVPIAFGYTLAHNFSLFVVTAPRLLAVISDPFGFGWNLFGTAQYIQQDLILGAKAVWFIEIAFIVLAHVVGVIYAHVIALNVFKDSRLALKSQYPMALLMVGYTALTLWLLSQPLVIAR